AEEAAHHLEEGGLVGDLVLGDAGRSRRRCTSPRSVHLRRKWLRGGRKSRAECRRWTLARRWTRTRRGRVTLVPVHLRADLAALLEHPDRIGDVPAAEVPALVLRLAALQAGVAARLHALASEADADDWECFAAAEVAR